MQFSSWSEFIAMGGYAFYVWLAFGVSFALIIGLVISSFTSHKSVKENIRKKIKRDERLKQAAEQQISQ